MKRRVHAHQLVAPLPVDMQHQGLAGLRQGAGLEPAIVLNGDLDQSIFANHLALQGFYMKRAILQLEDAVSVMAV